MKARPGNDSFADLSQARKPGAARDNPEYPVSMTPRMGVS